MQNKTYKNLIIGAGTLMDILPSRSSEGYRKGIFLPKKPSATRSLQDCWEKVGDTIRTATSEAILEEAAVKPRSSKAVMKFASKEDAEEWARIGKTRGIITRSKMREIVTQAIEQRIIEKE